MCDEIISVIDSALTNVTNTVLKNVTCTVSIHFNNKKVLYFAHVLISYHITIYDCCYLLLLRKA